MQEQARVELPQGGFFLFNRNYGLRQLTTSSKKIEIIDLARYLSCSQEFDKCFYPLLDYSNQNVTLKLEAAIAAGNSFIYSLKDNASGTKKFFRFIDKRTVENPDLARNHSIQVINEMEVTNDKYKVRLMSHNIAYFSREVTERVQKTEYRYVSTAPPEGVSTIPGIPYAGTTVPRTVYKDETTMKNTLFYFNDADNSIKFIDGFVVDNVKEELENPYEHYVIDNDTIDALILQRGRNLEYLTVGSRFNLGFDLAIVQHSLIKIPQFDHQWLKYINNKVFVTGPEGNFGTINLVEVERRTNMLMNNIKFKPEAFNPLTFTPDDLKHNERIYAIAGMDTVVVFVCLTFRIIEIEVSYDTGRSKETSRDATDTGVVDGSTIQPIVNFTRFYFLNTSNNQSTQIAIPNGLFPLITEYRKRIDFGTIPIVATTIHPHPSHAHALANPAQIISTKQIIDRRLHDLLRVEFNVKVVERQVYIRRDAGSVLIDFNTFNIWYRKYKSDFFTKAPKFFDLSPSGYVLLSDTLLLPRRLDLLETGFADVDMKAEYKRHIALQKTSEELEEKYPERDIRLPNEMIDLIHKFGK